MENHQGARTIIYSRDNCSYCTKAKELFATHGIQYEENKLDNIKELREKFQEFALVPKSFPQIFYKGTYIGGCTNLRDRLEEPLLVDNPDRFVVFPIKYQDMFEMYKKAVASFLPARAAPEALADRVLNVTVIPSHNAIPAVVTA